MSELLVPDAGSPPAPRPAFSLLAGGTTLRSALWQALALTVTAIVLGWFGNNAVENLSRANVASGFGFLSHTAGFSIIETPIEYAPDASYGRALMVGLLNGAKVAFLAIVLATVIGTCIGVLRLSSHPVASRLAGAYVELLRNVPLLLQLFFWYAILLKLPAARTALAPLPGMFLSNRGLFLPALTSDGRFWWLVAALLLATLTTVFLSVRATKIQGAKGHRPPVFVPSLLVFTALSVGAVLVFDIPFGLSVPELRGFNFSGGMVISPEFTALLIGLSLYSAAYIGETVRSGILSVGKGQWEAASAIGLTDMQRLRLVVMPQALRIIIPPMISSYGGIIKGTSLGVAIGFPELVSVSNTVMNQTGQAVETIGLVMAAFLVINLVIAAFLNWFNGRLAFKGR